MSVNISALFKKSVLKLAFVAAVGGGFFSCRTHAPELPQQQSQELTTQDIRDILALLTGPESTGDTVATYDLNCMQEMLPQMYRDLTMMRGLPITGAGIYDAVTDSSYHIKSSVMSYLPGAFGEYDASVVAVEEGSDGLTCAHEYFHAVQDVRDGDVPNENRLRSTDAVFCDMLSEATAVAYELVLRQEAANHQKTVVVADKGASMDSSVVATFHKAYDAAWRKNAGYKTSTRERKSLQAAGQEIVRYLMNGKNANWSEGYAEQAERNTLGGTGDTLVLNDAYRKTRTDIFHAQGEVSPVFNLVPKEYMGPQADGCIRECLKKVGIQEETSGNVKPKSKMLSL